MSTAAARTRSVIITVRLTENEAALLRARADAADCSVSAFVRTLVYEPPTRESRSGSTVNPPMGIEWNMGVANDATVSVR